MKQRHTPEDPVGWTKASIVAAIKNKGHTLTGLAKIHGYSSASISVCLCKPWPNVEKIIARVIGVPAHLIWPPRYDHKGMPIKRGKTKESRGMIHGEAGGTGRVGGKFNRPLP